MTDLTTRAERHIPGDEGGWRDAARGLLIAGIAVVTAVQTGWTSYLAFGLRECMAAPSAWVVTIVLAVAVGVAGVAVRVVGGSARSLPAVIAAVLVVAVAVGSLGWSAALFATIEVARESLPRVSAGHAALAFVITVVPGVQAAVTMALAGAGRDHPAGRSAWRLAATTLAAVACVLLVGALSARGC